MENVKCRTNIMKKLKFRIEEKQIRQLSKVHGSRLEKIYPTILESLTVMENLRKLREEKSINIVIDKMWEKDVLLKYLKN